MGFHPCDVRQAPARELLRQAGEAPSGTLVSRDLAVSVEHPTTWLSVWSTPTTSVMLAVLLASRVLAGSSQKSQTVPCL